MTVSLFVRLGLNLLLLVPEFPEKLDRVRRVSRVVVVRVNEDGDAAAGDGLEIVHLGF
jgi:hypothetical protein